MENKSLQKIIDIIRSLNEEGEGPTNSLAGGKIAGTVRKKNKYIYGAGFRKKWLQRRNPQP